MTPYELRFEVFKQALEIAHNKFHAEFGRTEILKKDEPTLKFPEFPTYEEVEEIANKINKFISSN
jgi:hypothetical protein